MVEILINNTSAVSYINKLGGTRSDALCAVALEIIDWCESRNLSLHSVYLPSKANYLADAESRRPVSSGDWKLHPQSFRFIQKIWKSQVDLFASSWNSQLPLFHSWYVQPGAAGGDAFLVSWSGIQGYCFPQFNLISFCMSKHQSS